MDLKLKDVAELLQVSETTIKRWLQEDKIPAYSIDNQFFFSRDEIQNWVLKRKTAGENIKPFKDPEVKKGGQKQYSLTRALFNGKVINDLNVTQKEELIRRVSKDIAQEYDLDPEGLSDLLLERERLHTTALGHGIAIPHTRELVLKNHPDRIILVFPKKPIEFEALDREPVYALFFLLASNDARHLHLLAKIAHLSSDPEALELLKQKPTKEKLLAFLRDWEAELN